jgi:mannose/fructose-specific phosphotransferase system component IIA
MATLQLTTNNDTQAKIVLTDLSGRTVSQQTTKLYAGKNQTSIDTQTLPNGMYLLTIDYNDSRVTQKMLVQH